MTAREGKIGRRLSVWLGLALFVAGLLNGIGPYLRRTGLIETALYERFWDLHTGPAGFTRSPLGLGRRCVVHRPVEEGGAEVAGGGPPALYVFAIRRWEIPGKALKDLLLLSLAAGSLLAWVRGRSRPVPLFSSWPPAALVPMVALAALVAWHAVAGLVRGAPLMTVAGLRAFGFLGIALVASWVSVETLRRLVPWLVGLLAVQLFLSPLEFLRGIPVQGHMYLFGGFFARRAMGTFVMPNTLGVFAACAVALAAGFGATARVRAFAWILGVLVVLASGSATGLVMLGAVGVAQALFGRRRSDRLVLSGLGAALLTVSLLVAGALLLVLVRPDVLDSLSARLHGMRPLFHAPALSVLFGRQIGLGTNTASQLGATSEGGESALSALILQTGVVGLALFAAALGLAWARNVSARPLVLALAVACLTLNVPEAFPMNLLLGLALACGPGPRASIAPRRPFPIPF